MKTSYIKFRNVFLLALGLLAAACSQEDDVSSSKQESQNLSEIELIEQELGHALFKKDLVISDESGKTPLR